MEKEEIMKKWKAADKLAENYLDKACDAIVGEFCKEKDGMSAVQLTGLISGLCTMLNVHLDMYQWKSPKGGKDLRKRIRKVLSKYGLEKEKGRMATAFLKKNT